MAMRRHHMIISGAWAVVILAAYMFFVDLSILPSAVTAPNHSPDLVHAVVMLAGGHMAEDAMVDLSVQSLRRVGGWHGDVYILTDRPECFASTVASFNVQPVHVPADHMDTIIKIKTLKAKLFEYLPHTVENILYMDVDIVVARKLSGFLNEFNEQLVTFAKTHRKTEVGYVGTAAAAADVDGSVVKSAATRLAEGIRQQAKAMPLVDTGSGTTFEITSTNAPDFAMFLDGGSHFAGDWVTGVEKWHTGIMWARRGAGESCMAAWADLLSQGKFDSDQQALDAVELDMGACPRAMALSFRHLLFAKDYLMMLFRGGQTFIHFTAAGRAEDRDAFYSKLVMPLLRGNIRPRLDLSLLDVPKVCTREHPLQT